MVFSLTFSYYHMVFSNHAKLGNLREVSLLHSVSEFKLLSIVLCESMHNDNQFQIVLVKTY